MNRYLKPLTFLPAILIMITIFHFSSQPAPVSSDLSIGVTLTIVQTADKVFHLQMNSEEQIAKATQLHGIVRKIAHITEYFILSLTLIFPLYLYGFRSGKLYVTVLVIAVLFSSGDEFHQSFVPGRACQIRDVFIDIGGVLISFLITHFFQRFR